MTGCPVPQNVEQSLKQQGGKPETAAEFVARLDQMHRSKAYLAIRDMTADMLRKIRGDADPNLYRKFQEIRQEAKKSWDYDHKTATMEDVNRACTNVYGMMLKILQAETSSFDPILNKMGAAINNIEERLGMPQTIWNEEEPEDGDADNAGNVEGITSGGQ